nr:M-phase phosphoprotein 6 [Leptinotarsa decemlineata]
MDNSKTNVKLSKGILDMKFMKKTKEKVEKEKDDLEGHIMYSSEITEEMRRSGNLVFVSTSMANIRTLVDGRLSFGGMNPEIEKLMANDYGKQLEDEEKRKEKDITDVEMAEGYSTLVNTMGKKFHGANRERKRKADRKFVKPADDTLY